MNDQVIDAGNYNIHTGLDSLAPLQEFLEEKSYSRVIVLCDQNTEIHCYPILKTFLPPHIKIKVPAGDEYKNLEYAQKVWKIMTDQLFDRKAVVVNIGGGMVGDLGGFVAAAYKRGVDFIQVPTTLLSMVDASVGGKTGVNFQGFKNQLGAFRDPAAIFVYPGFLKTLPEAEFRSGFAEMLKHGLITDAAHWAELTDPNLDPAALGRLIHQSVQIKLAIVKDDPLEKNVRKALNFGHTIGHAIESYSMSAQSSQKLRHGEAVALGMIAEAWIASKKRGLLSPEQLEEVVNAIRAQYEIPAANMEAWEAITANAQQDKKNADGKILMTLIGPIGQYHYDQEVSRADVFKSLKYLFRDLLK